MADQLVFLHLSDIHFRTWSGSVYDEDDILRHTLIRDAEIVKKQLGSPDGILISGDIAFKADPDEYAIARKWLEELCEKLGVSFAKIWCVPGNHDIDQTVIKNSMALKLVHKNLRGENPRCLSSTIRNHLDDPSGCSILKPLDGYNEFAAWLNCHVTPERPYWKEDFVLNDSSILRIYGLNSTIVSDHEDNDHQKVILGDYQLPPPNHGVLNLVIGHHPPSWWRDPDSVAMGLIAHCRVQLYGHKHTMTIQKIENSVVLVAGAVHPVRREPDWEPRFNWLCLSVQNDGDQRNLHVESYPRIWDKSICNFVADSNRCDGNDHRLDVLSLEKWEPTSESSQPSKSVSGDSEPANNQPGITKSVIEKQINLNEQARILTYRFFSLPHVLRIDIARELELYRDEDEGLQDYELFGRIFERAVQQDLLAKLWHQVEQTHADRKHEFNPFENKQN